MIEKIQTKMWTKEHELVIGEDPESIWLPTVGTHLPEVDTKRELLRRSIILKGCRENAKMREWVVDKCRNDFWFWWGTFGWVERPAHGKSPALIWEFQKEIVDVFMGWGRWSGPLRTQVIVKSRDMGITVVICAVSTWDWWRGDKQYLWGSRQEKDVDDKQTLFTTSVFAKIRFILAHLPSYLCPAPWLRHSRPRQWDSGCQMVRPESSSVISGMSASPDSARSRRAIRVIYDEATFIQNMRLCFDASSKTGAITMISSIRGADSFFSQCALGRALKIAKSPDEPGAVVHNLHYTDRPDLNPDTVEGRDRIEEMKANTTPEAWDQEMENNMFTSLPHRIWGEQIAEESKYTPDQWLRVEPLLENSTLIDSWDFGDGPSLTCWLRGAWIASISTLVLLDHRSFGGRDPRTKKTKGVLLDDIKNEISIVYRKPADYCVGDIAGMMRGPKCRAGRINDNVRSWIENMAEIGIEIKGQHFKVGKTIKDIREAFNENRIRFSPQAATRHVSSPHAPSPYEAFSSYRYDSDKSAEEYIGPDTPPKKDINSHLADCLQIMVARVLRISS